MTMLREKALADGRRSALVDDALEVLNAEVRAKTGLTGLAVGAAFKVLEGVRPGFVRQAVDDLLDGFLDALDPLYQQAIASGAKPGAFFLANEDQTAEALLKVTDTRATRASSQTIKKTYDRLRPSAKKHVMAAVPRLAVLIDRYTA
jgi:hypothetical protein